MNSRFPILDRPEVLNVLFHPRRDFQNTGQDPRAVNIPVEAGVTVGAKIFPAAPNAPAILYFHGNGEIASDYDELSRLYTSLGITLFVVDFRGYGTSGGSPTATTLIADAAVVADQVRLLLSEHGAACSRLYVMGRSLGSASAIEVAVHLGDAISGLIIESGFADTFALVERLGDIHFDNGDDSRHGFDNLGKISRVTLPTLFIHGETDWIIPLSDARALYRDSGASSKRLLTIPGAGHNDLMMLGLSDYFGAIREMVFGPSAT